MNERFAGVLLPITALPSPYGVGTVGAVARDFVDFLASAGQKIWQVLPIVPTGFGDSPYASSCASAGSPYLIDIDELIDGGLITRAEAEEYSCEAGNGVRYDLLFNRKIPLLKLAFSRFDREAPEFKAFLARGEHLDYAMFMAIKESCGWKPIMNWDKGLYKRDAEALSAFCASYENEIMFWQFTQYVLWGQWYRLKAYANARGVRIMGDMPLYVSSDSVEMWAHPELFLLDADGAPSEVAGVPPDYFSADGQLWGNPLYNWEKMKLDGYTWWSARIMRALEIYDILRIDHFRGFDRFYAIPADAENAKIGRWCDGPKEEFFADKLDLDIIAEDLGILDDGVYRLMKNTGFPGMKILEFAFDGNPDNAYKPSNCNENSVMYTGTHDNAPIMEFLENIPEEQRHIFYLDLARECRRMGVKFGYQRRYVRLVSTMQRARRALIELAFASRAKYVILPLQDILGTGRESRMNAPGVLGAENWCWRCRTSDFSSAVCESLSRLVEKYGR